MAGSLTVARRLKAGSGRKTRSSRSRTSMPDPDPDFAVFRGTAHLLSGLSSQGRTIAKGIPECQTLRAVLWYDPAPEGAIVRQGSRRGRPELPDLALAADGPAAGREDLFAAVHR